MNEKTFSTLRNYIILHMIIISLVAKPTKGIEYSWLQYNDKYDCIVGISVDNKPVTIGTILGDNFIVSAANPLERINSTKRIKLHLINGNFKKNKEIGVLSMTRDHGKRLTGGHWRTFGFDKRHAPQHDLILIATANKIDFGTGSRQPIKCQKMPNNGTIDSNGKFSFLGFGFIDRPHVKQNVELELVEYEYEEVFTECSEWIPKIWGHFICLKNLENFVGISAGAPLFFNDKYVGIGSFSVKRGNEGVLLFTNYLTYFPHIIYFTN